MKKCIFTSMLMIFSLSILEAQVVPDTSSTVKPSTVNNKISPAIGIDVLIGDMGAGMGAKAGISYSINHIQIDGLLGISISWAPILVMNNPYFSSSEWTYSRIFPHLMVSGTKRKVQPYIMFGAGQGNFEVNWSGGNNKWNQLIWGFGGGFKYKNLAISITYFGPKIDDLRKQRDDGRYVYESVYNGFQYTLGILGNP